MRARRPTVALLIVLALASCNDHKSVAMPDVTGKKLDTAYAALKDAGLGDKDKIQINGGGMFGVVVESNWTVCDQSPTSGTAVTGAPKLTIARSCDEASPGSETTTPTPTSEPYVGPQYTVVTVDKNQGPAQLDQYWVVTKPVTYSTNAYKDQIKLLIADVARKAGTNKLIVEVVSDKEIADAESPSTYKAFVAAHGTRYAEHEIPKKEKTGWIASYTGGSDPDTYEASDADNAFEILWRPYGNGGHENWKPQI